MKKVFTIYYFYKVVALIFSTVFSNVLPNVKIFIFLKPGIPGLKLKNFKIPEVYICFGIVIHSFTVNRSFFRQINQQNNFTYLK